MNARAQGFDGAVDVRFRTNIGVERPYDRTPEQREFAQGRDAASRR